MWRTLRIIFLFSWMPDVSMRQNCKYHDVVEYLNITSKRELFLYSIPKKNWEDSLEVGLEFTLLSILSVQEKLQVATFYFWLSMAWKNEFISWNPLDFCNISTITLPVNLFWIPDISIDEQADEKKITNARFVHLFYDGTIILYQAHLLTSACNMDVHTFPFDEQKCKITLAPSLYRENEVKFKNAKPSRNTNQDSRLFCLASGEWNFQKVEITEVTEIHQDEKFSRVIYEIIMKRRSILYELIVILPIFVLFLLDMAISFAFASPAENIAFKVTMILQVSFLSMMLIEKLPPTSDNPPVIAIFFTGIFSFMVLGILENACMEYFKEQNSKFPSFKTKNFIRKFMRKEKIKAEDSATDVGEETDIENKSTREFPLVENDSTDSLVFLKQVTLELQQIKKHLALEEGKEVSGPPIQNKFAQFEKGFYYTRLILSLGFIAFIVVQWTN